MWFLVFFSILETVAYTNTGKETETLPLLILFRYCKHLGVTHLKNK